MISKIKEFVSSISLATLDRFFNVLIFTGMLFTALGFVYVIGKGIGYDHGIRDAFTNHPIQEIMYAPGAKSSPLNICAFDKEQKVLMCERVETFFERN